MAIDNSGRISAYNSFYAQGKEALLKGEKEQAKKYFLEAARLAEEISKNSQSASVRTDYHTYATRILALVQADFKVAQPKPVSTQKQENKNSEADSSDDQPIFETLGKVDTRFSDVAGLEDVKQEILSKVIRPYQNADLARLFGINPGAKIVLYGPPGTGKTFIARAIAGEIDAAFYSVKCSDLVNKFLGDSSKNIEKLFKEAQKNEKAIIFFDEFDSIASSRGDGSSGADGEMARMVSSLLVNVDGIKKDSKCKMLLLIAATNIPWNLDKAVTRGGRFETMIYVGLPDKNARLFLAKTHMGSAPRMSDVTDEWIAEITEGYGGGDIASICQSARSKAFYRSTEMQNKTISPVARKDFEYAMKYVHKSANEEMLEKFRAFKEGHI